MPPRPFCQQPFRSQGQPWPRRSGLQSGVFLDSLLFLLHPCPFHQQSLLATLKVTPEHDCCPTSSASAHCHLSGLPVPALPPVWCVLNPVTTVTLPRVCRGGPPRSEPSHLALSYMSTNRVRAGPGGSGSSQPLAASPTSTLTTLPAAHLAQPHQPPALPLTTGHWLSPPPGGVPLTAVWLSPSPLSLCPMALHGDPDIPRANTTCSPTSISLYPIFFFTSCHGCCT